MSSTLTKLSALICCMLTTGAYADLETGRELHEENCIECHMMDDHTALYTRADRKVDSLHRLGGQVSACTQILNITWFPEEERDVVEYLNTEYYHFSN
ncbi:MAG: cytochrome c [Gammaproteobacteria bacterium]|nr:cytochrome c [Gammaproteobacteria bacterium]